MGAAEMVGLIGLTFFCNKCVELFYKFRKDGVFTEELSRTCDRAIRAFESLKWPNGGTLLSDEKVPLFNTNEEVKSFEQVISSQNEEFDNTTLDKWVGKLQSMLDENIPLEEKRQVAEELQKLFDTLGDYSFYATRESIRSSESMV